MSTGIFATACTTASNFASNSPSFLGDGLEVSPSVLAAWACRSATVRPPTRQAWPPAQQPWIVPIPRKAKRYRLEENMGAIDLEPTAEVLKKIADKLANIQAQGLRLPKQFLAMSRL
jgi:hypothetical protein